MSSSQTCPLVSGESSFNLSKEGSFGEHEGIELENIQVKNNEGNEDSTFGLTSEEAYKRLCEIIRHELLVFTHANDVGWWQNFIKMLTNPGLHSSFSWTSLLFITLEILLLLLGCFFQEERKTLPLVEVTIILILTLINSIVCVKEEQLKMTELSRKIGKFLNQCQRFKKRCAWDQSSYPDLSTPSTSSLSLVWTYRKNKLVNVPSNLLVEGDVIVVAPSQKCPAKVQQITPSSGKIFDMGEIFHPDFEGKDEPLVNDKIFSCKPCPRQRFTVLESPLKDNLRNTFSSSQKRPMTLIENECYFVTKEILEFKLIPSILAASFLINVLRFFLSKKDVGPWAEMVFTLQAHVIIPLLPLLFPLMWIVINCYGTARIQVLFDSGSEQLSDGTLQLSDVNYQFWKNFKGESDTLTRTANLLHLLGSISVWCCVDKDGILALPDPNAEKVFFFRKKKEKRHKKMAKLCQAAIEDEESEFFSSNMVEDDEDFNVTADVLYKRSEKEEEEEEEEGEGDSRQGGSVVSSPTFANKEYTVISHSEVLNLSCDPQSEFGIIFDDFRWQRHLSSLKPLGLNVLLNSPCSSPANAIKLEDHLGYVSLLVNDAPIRSVRRCLCLLGKQIGFVDAALNGFKRRHNIFAFRASQLNDSVIKSHSFLSVCKENPIPFLTSLVVEHVPSGTYQLLSQGSADLLLDVCSDFWDGSEVHPLTSLERRKIRDFFHRTSITSNCIALSYRPITQPWRGSSQDVYLEFPEQVEWSYSDSDSGSMSSSKSSSSSQDEQANRGQFSTSLNDNAIDLEFYQRIIGGQIFVGMITLQQQAKQDIPSLVEDLDNAGIRFVHFSEENEIKSRVFAERLGLETGWNCHISFSEKTGFDEHSTLTGGSDGKIDETADEYFVSHDVPAHSEGAEVMKEGDEICHEEENKEGKQVDEMNLIELGGAVDDVEMTGDEENGKKVKWRESEENINEHKRKLSESTSSSSMSNIEGEEDGENQGVWNFNNRAKLPRGIGNIRAHLKDVDNVPLLVPLFTDCTPEATREMIAIMQEYGEVVCCIGSSLNVANVQIFNQADISIALQPSFPQVCLKDRTQLFDSRSSTVAPTPSCETDVLLTTGSGHLSSQDKDLTPLGVSSALNGISCSLSFSRDYNIKFVALLKEARRLCFGLHNCFSFMLSCQLTLCLVMLAASLLTLPPPMTGLHLLWFSCVSVPVLSTSLVNAANDSDLMTMTMAKNDKNFVGYIWSFVRLLGLAFVPPFLLCDLVIFPLTLRSFCQRFVTSNNQCHYFHGEKDNPEFWNGFGETHLLGLALAQDVIAFFLMLCFVFMSTSYVHRLHPLWRRSPFSNKPWIAAVFIVISLQVVYTAFSRVLWKSTTKNKNDYHLSHLPTTVVCLVSLWPLVQLLLCELLKRKYIKFFIRYQKRAKLKFGTKLGMNSPF